MSLIHGTGYEVMQSESGDVLQSGVQSRLLTQPVDVSTVQGWVSRAVVLQTYYADEDKRSGLLDPQRCVLCDVRTYGRYSRFLPKVPVLQATHGLHDENLYVPRPAKVNTEGGTAGGFVISEPSDMKVPTSAENLDADHVLIGFLDNDPSQPVILPYVLAHPKAKFVPTKAAGRVRRIRHNGTLVEWDAGGNWTLDATGASQADLLKDGSEITNSGVGGEITIKTKDVAASVSQIKLDKLGGALVEAAGGTVSLTLTKGVKATLLAPIVELASGPRERAMLTETYNSAEADMLAVISDYIAANAQAWSAAGQALPALIPPDAKQSLQAVEAVAKIAAFSSSAANWESTKVKVG